MIRIMPDWYSEAEKELERAIFKIAQDNNLKLCFIMDSKTIEQAKSMMLQAMVSIYDNSAGQFTQEELKHFKMIEEAMKNSEKNREKNSDNNLQKTAKNKKVYKQKRFK